MSARARPAAAPLLAAFFFLALSTDAGAQRVENTRLSESGRDEAGVQTTVKVILPPEPRAPFQCRTVEVSENAPVRRATLTRVFTPASDDGRVPAMPAVDGDFILGTSPNAPDVDSDGNFLFAVVIEDDDIVEHDEVFRLLCDNGFGTPQWAGGFTTIVDNDVAEVSVAPVLPFPGGNPPNLVKEGNDAQFEVTLSNPVATEVTVDYAVAEGDDANTPNADIMEASGTLTFAPGEMSKTITVTTIEDSVAEGVESFTVSLSNLAGSPRPGAVLLGTAKVAAIIRANDMSDGLSLEGGSAAEGEAVTFTVRRGGPQPLPELTVEWATDMPGSGPGAAAATDFTAASGTATVPQGSRVATFTVMTVDDDLLEGEETFTVTLSNPADPSDSTAVIGLRTATATGRILPSDEPATLFLSPAGDVGVVEGGMVEFTARLSRAFAESVTVDYTLEGFCVNGFVRAPGGGLIGCPAVAAAESARANPADIAGVGGTPAGFTNEADPHVFTRSLVFAPGETEKTFSVQTQTGQFDSSTYVDQIFMVRLSFPESDPRLRQHRRDAQATVTIIDNDEATLSVVPVDGNGMRLENAEVNEGGTIDFQVRLSGILFNDGAGGPAVRSPVIVSGTASADDFTAPAPETSRADGGDYSDHVLATFSIETTDDDLVETDETFTVWLGAHPGFPQYAFDPVQQEIGGIRLAPPLEVTILDDDTTTVVSGFADAEAPEGGSIEFTVELSEAHTGDDLMLNYAVTPGTAAEDDFTDFAAEGSGTVTFRDGDSTATITLGTMADDTAEADETFTVTLTAPAGVSGVRLDAATATGTILNDDMAVLGPVEVRILDVEEPVPEGEDITFTVQLSRPLEDDADPLTLNWFYDFAFSTAGFDDVIAPDGVIPGTVISVTIQPGEDSVDIPVGTAAADGMRETTEELALALRFPPGAPPPGVVLADAEASAMIRDGDSRSVSLEGGGTVIEGDPIMFTVRVTNPASASFMVNWNVPAGISDSASTDDFTSLTGAVEIPAGETAVPFMVGTAADAAIEGEETFTVRLAGLAASGSGAVPENTEIVSVPSEGLTFLMARVAPRATATATIVDRNAAPEMPQVAGQHAIAGSEFTYQFAAVFDLNRDTVTYSAALSDDGVLPGWLTFNPATRTFSGTPTAADAGSISVRITATDDGDPPQSASADFTVTVLIPLEMVVMDQTAFVGRMFTYTFDPVSGPNGGALTYTATLPDGNALPDWLSFDGSARTFSGTPTAGDLDPVTVRVTAAGLPLPPMSADFTITVQRLPARHTEIVRAITPEVARAVAINTVGAIAGRVSAAASSSAAAGGVNFNGHATLEDALAARAQTMTDGGKDIKDILNGADFALPLNAAGDGSGASALAFWGGGEYRNLGGENRGLDWDGELFSAHLGVDARLPNNLLAGAAVSWSESDLDYDTVMERGDYELDLTAIHPYLGWTSPDGLGNMWATVGYGEGDLEITPDAGESSDSDVDAMMAGVGGSREVLRSGGSRLRIKGEMLYSEMAVDASDDGQIESLEVDANRVRVSVEVSRPRTTANGARMEPSAELGLRHDGGDGETGTGVEVGAGIVYTNPASGVTVEGRARALAGHSGDYDDWGVSGLIRLAPGADGQGLSFSVSPGYGDTESEVQKIWRQGLSDTAIVDDGDERDYGMRLDAALGYGISAPDWWFGGDGMLTPYTGMTLGDSSRSYRLGLNWKLDTRFEFDLVGEASESTADSVTDPVENAVLLKGTVYF